MIKDLELAGLIEKITDQYETLHGNGLVRNALAAIEIPYQYRVAFDIVVHAHETYRMEGLSYDDLYLGIIGLSHYIYAARVDISPLLQRRVSNKVGNEAILERMATDNMKANLGALADRVSELYVLAVKLDNNANPRKPSHKSYPELNMVGTFLTSQTPGLLRQ
ncbi:MAG: hypothetical protein PF447_05955 [Spirochaetaceae bacterium]|jgi:hypothetical protein|nr:hypothetical protein [Spirochaetaceae bacterium]